MKDMPVTASPWLVLLAACGSVAGMPSKDAPPSDAQVGDAAAAMDCRSSRACAEAPLLGTLVGDASQSQTTARGDRSAWLRVRMIESDGSAVGRPMSVQATLRSSGPARFEVHVYVNPATDLIECTTPSGAASTAGAVSTASVAWGEATVANGTDDSRDVIVEVRALASTCTAMDAWDLTIAGNAGQASVRLDDSGATADRPDP